MEEKIVVGAVKGRHEMDVDEYIIKGEIGPELLTKDGFPQLIKLVEEEVEKFLEELDPETEIILRITGLTRVTVLLMEQFFLRQERSIGGRSGCQRVTIQDYDRSTLLYFDIIKIGASINDAAVTYWPTFWSVKKP